MDNFKKFQKLSFLANVGKFIASLPFPANVIVIVVAIILIVCLIILLVKVIKWVILGLLVFLIGKLFVNILRKRNNKSKLDDSNSLLSESHVFTKKEDDENV